MTKTVTATDANRRFSEILADVRAGNSYTITSHGKPVAKLVAGNDDEASEKVRKAHAFRELLAHLDQQPVMDIGPWTREELYEDDE